MRRLRPVPASRDANGADFIFAAKVPQAITHKEVFPGRHANISGKQERPGPDDPGQSLRKFTAVISERLHCHYRSMSTMSVVVCVTPPPVPFMVIVWSPVLARLFAWTVTVDVPEPGAGMEVGLNCTVTPVPSPEADKAIAELKPPEIVVVTVAVPELFLATVIDVGDTLMVKLGAVPVTVRATVVVSVMPPEVPITEML